MKMVIFLSLKLIVAVLSLTVSVLASSTVVTKTGIQFVEGLDAVDMILSGPSAPCVPRLPVWEIVIGEGSYNRFDVHKANEDCREELTAAIRDFSDEEKNILMKYVVFLDSIIDTEFPALNSFPWSFAVIGDSAAFGVPVSDRHIVLTKKLLGDMHEWMEKQTRMLFVGMEILVREKVLLLQAAAPEPFDKFYQDVWGFRKLASSLSVDILARDYDFHFSRIPINEWAVKAKARARSKEYIMPTLQLRDRGNGDGAVQHVALAVDSTTRGLVLRRGKTTPIEFSDMRQYPQYRQRFPQSKYIYHPAVLVADLIAKYLVAQYVSAEYGTASAKIEHYSQIDVLIRYMNEASD